MNFCNRIYEFCNFSCGTQQPPEPTHEVQSLVPRPKLKISPSNEKNIGGAQSQNTSETAPSAYYKDSQYDSSCPNMLTSAGEKEPQLESDLQFEVIESDYLREGATFIIYSNCKVNNKDPLYPNKCYFGRETPIKPENDIIIGKQNKGSQAQCAYIQYNQELQKFEIVDVGGGDGLYVRIDKPVIIPDESVISYGDGHFIIKISEANDEQNDHPVNIKFIDGPEEGREEFLNTKVITLGRNKNCTIPLASQSISRVQLTIARIEGRWMIFDGDGAKHSTNGSWFFVEKRITLEDRMRIKIDKTIFKANLI